MSQLGSSSDLFIKNPSRPADPAASANAPSIPRPAPMDDTIVALGPAPIRRTDNREIDRRSPLDGIDVQQLLRDLAAAQKDAIVAQQKAATSEERRLLAEQRLSFAEAEADTAKRKLERRTVRWEERIAKTAQMLNDSEARLRDSEKQQRSQRRKIKSLEQEVDTLKSQLQHLQDSTNGGDSESESIRRAVTLNGSVIIKDRERSKSKKADVEEVPVAKKSEPPIKKRQEPSTVEQSVVAAKAKANRPPQSLDSLQNVESLEDLGSLPDFCVSQVGQPDEQFEADESSKLLDIPNVDSSVHGSDPKAGGFTLTASVLGSGAFVRVHGARDRATGKEAAAKLIKLDGPHGALREDQIEYKKKLAQREATILKTLQHPNIMKLLGEESDSEGLPRLILERIDGRLLSDITVEGPMEIARVRHLFSQLCSAVQAAHDRDIIHRDIKPSNIIVSPIPGGEHLMLIDFGIARSLSEPRLAETMDSPMGSPPFMAPEIWRGVAEPGIPADIYALGVVLFEMLTGGQRPFVARNFREWEDLHCKAMPRSPRDFSKTIEKATEEVIFKALEKVPQQRYASAIELLDAFEASLNVNPIYRFIRQVSKPLERLLPD